MTDLFLSYKAEDRARVAPLVQALETDGLSVWWDEHIGGGDDWRDTILRHLEAARAVIVVWSRRSVGPNGQFVRDEATRALKRGTYLPVRIDKVDPPLGFGETQALELHGWKGDRSDARYQAVLSTLRKRLGIKAVAAKQSGEQASGVTRRTLVIGAGAVAVASAAGIAAWLLPRGHGGKGDSIAVLPFANLSGDPAQAYFSEGIAEELRSALSRVAGLKVVARTSSEAVKDADAKTAAHKLGVNNILTGSVRRSPQMIRVSAQLVDGRQGLERWAEVYDRPPADALQVQTDIANKVAEALSIRLGGPDRERLAQGGTDNPAAHDLLLKAEDSLRGGDDNEIDRLERTMGIVDAALALDPKYGAAWALKASLLQMKAGGHSLTAAEYRANYAAAEQVARKAIQVAPQSRLGYSVLAEILDQQLKRRAALVQFQKMLALPGEDGRTLPVYATFLSEIGRTGEALRTADEALAVDPLNPQSFGRKAAILAGARRYDDAIRALDESIKLVPGLKGPRGFRAYCVAMSGKPDEARRQFETVWGDPALAPPGWAAALVARDHAMGQRLLARVQQTAGDGAHYQYAQIYAQLGDRERALQSLERAWEVRDPGLTMMLIDPMLDPVRKDPRFAAVLKHVDNPT